MTTGVCDNSVITSTFATLFALVVGVPAAYAMAFDPSRHTKDILMWMLSTKMLPAAAVLYPMTFLTKNFLGIFDTHFLGDLGAMPDQLADRDLDVVHLLQRDPERDHRSGSKWMA